MDSRFANVLYLFMVSSMIVCLTCPSGISAYNSNHITKVVPTIIQKGSVGTRECSNNDSTANVVYLANAFEASLSEAERKELKYDLTLQKAASWSNRPAALDKRNGLRIGSLDLGSLAAFKALAAEALGESGYQTLDSIILADEYLKKETRKKMYGIDNYYVAFYGEPSVTSPWILQITGHHFTSNIPYHGKATSATPMFVGVEPQSFTFNGITYHPLANRRDAVYSLIKSLNPTKLSKARIYGTFNNVLLGPGQDAKFPESQGIPVAMLNSHQKQLVKDAITVWVKDTNPDISSKLLKAYLSEEALNKTTIGWSGSTDYHVHGSYIRIDGPRVWIEFNSRPEIELKNQIHFHSIWRDKTADYGGIFNAK